MDEEKVETTETTTGATEPDTESAQQIVRDHIANGGTAFCSIMVPVGALVVILAKGKLEAMEIGVGEMIVKDVCEAIDSLKVASGCTGDGNI